MKEGGREGGRGGGRSEKGGGKIEEWREKSSVAEGEGRKKRRRGRRGNVKEEEREEYCVILVLSWSAGGWSSGEA